MKALQRGDHVYLNSFFLLSFAHAIYPAAQLSFDTSKNVKLLVFHALESIKTTFL